MLQTLLGVLVGWGLTELSNIFRARREHRLAIGQALSELLELRHWVLILADVVKEVASRLKAPPEVQTVLRSVICSLIPGLAELPRRYVEAAAKVAGVSPVLAYRLRGPETALPLLNQLAGLAASEPSAARIWPGLEAEIMRQVRPRLEELIRKAAWCHGWGTWLAVRRLLRKPVMPPSEMTERVMGFLPQFPAGAAGGSMAGGPPPASS